MPSHETLRIRTPPPDEEPVVVYVNPHKNIAFMLVFAIILHTTDYLVTCNELFLWISVLFACLAFLIMVFFYKKKVSRVEMDSAV
jgi:Ca2+/Na+ antiporter